MRRTGFFWASQLLNIAATPIITAAGTESYKSGIGGLFFADRAVKMTNVNSAGCSFTCTPTVLSCKRSTAAAAVHLVTDEAGCVPFARVLMIGNCSVSLLRSRRVVFHCAGEENREQRHELALKRGDIITILTGCDLLRDWTSVERTWRSVANEDLEYIAEEMLLELSTSARSTTTTRNGAQNNEDNDNKDGVADNSAFKKESASSGTCIMATVCDKSSALLPQPPASMHFSAY